MSQTALQVTTRQPYLIEPPSITYQTEWRCNFFVLPDHWRGAAPACHFNCGLVNWLGGDWLITRTQTGPVSHPRKLFSRVVMWLLKDGKVSPNDNGSLVQKFTSLPDEQMEDPRGLVGNTGQLFLSMTCWRNAVPGNYAHQVFGAVDEHFEMLNPWHVVYGKNTKHLLHNRGFEKNWVWFSTSDGFRFVYSMSPHIVCEVVDGVVIGEHKTTGASWKYGEPRGGTPPVLVGDNYYSFFHSSMRWQDPFRRYFCGAYSFSAEPPYKIMGITPYPLLFGSIEDPRLGPAPIVVFPCGSLLRDGKWLVTLGCNDCRCAWLELPHDELLDAMQTV